MILKKHSKPRRRKLMDSIARVGAIAILKEHNKPLKGLQRTELINSIARVGAILRFNSSNQRDIDRYLEQVIKEAVKSDCYRILGG